MKVILCDNVFIIKYSSCGSRSYEDFESEIFALLGIFFNYKKERKVVNTYATFNLLFFFENKECGNTMLLYPFIENNNKYIKDMYNF